MHLTPAAMVVRVARPVAASSALVLAWLLVTLLGTLAAGREDPLFQGVPVTVATWAVAATLSAMWRELAASGCCLVALVALFGIARGGRAGDVRSRIDEGVVDAVLVGLALYLGIALEHPAVLRHAVLWPVRGFPVLAVTLALAGGVVAGAAFHGSRARGRSGVARHLGVSLAVVLVGWLLAIRGPARALPPAERTKILLGLDSLSQADPVGPLRQFTLEHGGAWYERAVTPGLLTNAVWPALLTSRPASHCGVFFVFQSPDWRSFRGNLVDRARARGLETVSFFPDQFTSHVGSDAGFDVDRSGPRGWMQVTTAAVKDASVFLPVLLPRLPRIPGAVTPANQAGTFAYDLKRELSEILSAGGVGRPALVAAHLNYLHEPTYPSSSQLTRDERWRVLLAPVSGLVDRSLHWQYPVVPGEPLGVHEWKLRTLLRTLAAVLAESGFLDPARKNQLVVFSDHGSRVGITNEDFGREEFFRVLLATFGVPAGATSAPISLLDADDLIGLPDPGSPAPADPVVEYVNVSPEEWQVLLESSRPLRGGGVQLNREILLGLGRRLRGFRPYTRPSGYFAAPVDAAPEGVATAGPPAARGGD